MSWQFGAIETALTRVFNVADADLGSFKARLWNLRKLGVVKSRKAGSGSRETFNLRDAVALRLALELNALGLKPSVAVMITHDALRYQFALDLRPEGSDRDVYVFVSFLPFLAEKYYPLIAEGEIKVAQYVKENQAASYMVVNISRLVREMVTALGE
jgi:hypothetical protein